jgi:lipoprotein NlpD
MSALLPYFRFGSRARRAAALAMAALVAAGCASTRPAPVEDHGGVRASGGMSGSAKRPATGEAGPATTYTVKRGDTLYQIALDNGLDYRELAAWNNIDNVNRIYAGQVLRLAAPGQLPAAAQAAAAGGTAAPAGSHVGVAYAPVGASEASGTVPDGASSAPDGVTTAPLRSVPPVVAAPIASGTFATPAATGAGVVAGAPVPAGAASGTGNLKTSPKAIKQPYSDRVVREMTLEASSVPAPPTAVVASLPAPGASLPASVAPQSPAAPNAAATGTAAAGDDQLNWMWPAKGKVIAQFSDTANLKGIDIAGTAGQPVYASAAGRVVYAGSGLRGYGKLIIIKHNATYLSA